MSEPETSEVWALCRVARDRLFRLRYTLEAYEGLCLATTAPGRGGLVWLRTSPGLRRELGDVLDALAHEIGVEVLAWGEGVPRLPEQPGGAPQAGATAEEVSMETVRVHVRVEGRVQGVWFRASTRDTAERLGLSGWVRNLPDGAVEAAFEGPRPAVEQAVEWCRRGPPDARVDGCEVGWESPTGARPPFEVRRT